MKRNKLKQKYHKETLSYYKDQNGLINKGYMKLATEIWDKHIDVFMQFDLVCYNRSSLEDETRSNALFNALVTLETMYKWNDFQLEEIQEAVDYLKGSKYYSNANQNSIY